MNLSNVNIISRNEAKILRRAWLFRVLSVLALTGIFFFQLTIQSDFSQYQAVKTNCTFPSCIPYLNVYLFNFLAWLIIIFMATDLFNPLSGKDTRESKFVRPASNGDIITGKAIAMTRVIMELATYSLLLAAIVNLFFQDHPLNTWTYLLYWLAYPLPSAVFMIGLAALVISVIRHKLIATLLLIALILLEFYLVNHCQLSSLDIQGITLPATRSDFTGLPLSWVWVIQRLSWVCLGCGMLFLATRIQQRPQDHPIPARIQVFGTSIFILLGITCIFLQYRDKVRFSSSREAYKNAYLQHENDPRVHVRRHVISCKQIGDKLVATSKLLLENLSGKEVSPVTLYLNPSLKVKQVKGNTGNLHFSRKLQVLEVDAILNPKDTISITLDYEGGIEEAVCYLDFPDDYLLDSRGGGLDIFRPGKRFAFLEKAYTLLTPECLWYPVSVPPVNLKNNLFIDKNFTLFELHVEEIEGRTVISQGKRLKKGNKIIFKHRHPLTGITLCAGKFESHEIQVDSINYELHHATKHLDMFSQFYPQWRESLPNAIREFKENMENLQHRAYPFERFIVVETPASFFAFPRMERGECELVQPELVLLPERTAGYPLVDPAYMKQMQKMYFNTPGQTLAPIEGEKLILNDLFHKLFYSDYGFFMGSLYQLRLLFPPPSQSYFSTSKNLLFLAPLFNQHVNHVYSPLYPCINNVLYSLSGKGMVVQDKYAYITSFSPIGESKAIHYLQEHSLQEVLENNIQEGALLAPQVRLHAVKLKTENLLELYFDSIPPQEATSFILDYLEEHEFECVDFPAFDKDFSNRFGKSWQKVLPTWYESTNIPRYIIQNLFIENIQTKNQTGFPRSRLRAEIYNDSEVDGVISINYTVQEQGKHELNLLVKAGEAREIAIMSNFIPMATLSTGVSRNLPTHFEIHSLYSTNETPDTASWNRSIEPTRFFPAKGEIIVDDLSEDFSILSANKPKGRLLQRWLQKKKKPMRTDEKYPKYYSALASPTWTQVYSEIFFGGHLKTGYIKKCGQGDPCAKWRASIKESGYYEVFAYIPWRSILKEIRIQKRSHYSFYSTDKAEKAPEQTYIVKVGDQEEETSIALEFNNLGWISLGRYYFPEGETTVILLDKGEEGQIIHADAMKWIPVNSK